jgi:hypothetical protein
VAHRALVVVVAVGVAGALMGALVTGRAAANPVSLAFGYTCVFPLINDQPATIKIETDVPKSAMIGVPTPKFGFSVSVSVNAAATNGLRLSGISSIEGTADAQAGVTAPQGKINVPVTVVVPRTSLPETGSLSVKVAGVAPALTFSRPGHATLTIGDFVLHLTPKDANGNVTFPGTFDAPCALDPGQDNVVASFDLVRPRRTAGPVTSSSTGTPTPTTAAPATPLGTDDATSSTPDSRAIVSGGTDLTGGQNAGGVILLTAGAFVAGGLVVIIVFRFRSRGDRPGQHAGRRNSQRL